MRMLPYRTVDNVIDGVVITFVDMTDRRHVEEALRAAGGGLDRRMAFMTGGSHSQRARRRFKTTVLSNPHGPRAITPPAR